MCYFIREVNTFENLLFIYFIVIHKDGLKYHIKLDV